MLISSSGWKGLALILWLPIVKELQAAGCESLRAIAAGLEERGIPAAPGGKWSAVQVSRLLEAAAVPFDASAAAVA